MLPHLPESSGWLNESAHRLLPQRLAVGWSGGIDSTALLLTLANRGYDVQAWHIDHGWHDASAEQCEELAGMALKWGIPFRSQRLTAAPGVNREAAARSGRYQGFVELAAESGVDTVALAHHRDDQAETVCMRMLQGAGVRGISAMKSSSDYHGVRIVRPFLHLFRSDIRKALVMNRILWLEDESNSDTTLWRNRLRHSFFPALKMYGADPTELFMRWQSQAELLSEHLDEVTSQIEMDGDHVSCTVEWQQWQELSAPLRASVLQMMMRRLFGPGCVAGRRHILLVEQWRQQGGNGGLDLSRSRLMRKDGRLLLTK